MIKCSWCENPVSKNPWTGKPLIVMLQKVCESCKDAYNEDFQKWGH